MPNRKKNLRLLSLNNINKDKQRYNFKNINFSPLHHSRLIKNDISSNINLELLSNKKDINFNNNIFLSMNRGNSGEYYKRSRRKASTNLVKISNSLDKRFLINKTAISNIKLMPDDSLNIFVEKTNYNFDQINNNILDLNSLPPKQKFHDYKIYPVPPLPVNDKIINPPIKENIEIDFELNSIQNIIQLIDKYPIKTDIEYNIDLKSLHKIKPHLIKLDNMIGMTKLKDSVVEQIIYFAGGLDKGGDFMHTVIYGPPGTGKTEVAKIIGNIFSSLGILKSGKFKKATRSDLIAGYLGQTALKTKDLIESCLNGVLFIDEAYALGNTEKRDSFAKECIDTICEALSDHKSDLMVIIAGYEKELEDCFFSYNSGLTSRFPWRFHTNDYTSSELNNIFKKKVNDINWFLDFHLKDDWFEDKKLYFKYYGRDIENLLSKIKIAHSKRVFCKYTEKKRYITVCDMERGFEKFIDNDEIKSRNKIKPSPLNMYL